MLLISYDLNMDPTFLTAFKDGLGGVFYFAGTGDSGTPILNVYKKELPEVGLVNYYSSSTFLFVEPFLGGIVGKSSIYFLIGFSLELELIRFCRGDMAGDL